MRTGIVLRQLLVAGFLIAAYEAEPLVAANGSETSGPPAGYNLVRSFSEDFNGGQLDARKWGNIFASPGSADVSVTKRSLPYNGEWQIYFDKSYLGLSIDPFTVKGGALTITARPLDDRAKARLKADIAEHASSPGIEEVNKAAYSSGLISTRGLFAQQFGYFEMRARWSAGKGLWPAFWLLPEGGGWPPEIDIMEAHGDKNTIVFQSAHSRLQKPKGITNTVPVRGGATQDFHRYGVLWLPDRMDFYIDGVKTSTIPCPPDMNKKMYILANLAVGGYWAGYPNKAEEFPATMEIDYIRAWRFK